MALPDIPPPPEEEEEIELDDLAAFVGRSLLDLNTNFFGVVRTRTDRRTGRTVYWLSDPNTGRAQDLRTGATLVDPSTRAVTNISASTTGSAADSTVTSGGKLSEADLRRLFGEEDTGGGGSTLSFASSQAAQTQAETFATGERIGGQKFSAEQAEIDRQAAIEQAEFNRRADIEAATLREEGANRRQRLSTLSDLIQGFLDQQSQARNTLANLQPDPFKFAAVAGGIAPFGTTPQQGFQTQLQDFAGAAVPQFDPSGSAASLDPIIAQLTGAQAPQAPQAGFAGGGTVPTPFNTMSARMVGEKGPEVMVTSPQGVTILPLGKGAQEGGFFPFQPIKFDAETMLPSLTTSGIFSGFPAIPRAERRGAGILQGREGRGGLFTQGLLGQLGIGPQLFQTPGQPVTLLQNGVARPFSNMEALTGSGFDPRNITQVDAATYASLLRGAERDPISEAINPADFLSTQRPSSFTKFSQPIIEPTTGTLLPAPFMVAEQLNKLRLTDPGALNLLLSAYESAGVPREAVLGGIQSSLSFGQERGSVGLR